MQPTSSTIEPEELLAQRAWVEGLARRLVGDSELARDVAQEAWVVALERPPRSATAGPSLRAWLARVTRTLARDLPRGDARRAAREARAGRERAERASVPATVDVVTRGALQQRVVQAVLELDEPYRSAVLLRFLDGLAGPEIARRQGTTPATARKHVQRGLEKLRERLARELEDHGGLAGLCMLIPTGAPAPTAALPVLPIGALLAMSVTTKLCLTAALVAVGVGLAWRFSSPSDSPATPATDRELVQAASHGALPIEEWRATAPDPSRRAAPRPPVTEAGGVPASAGGMQPLMLHARVLDSRGWPLTSATVAVYITEGELGKSVPVDGDGRAHLELARPLPLQRHDFGGELNEPYLVVRAEAPGHAAHRWFPMIGEQAEIDLGEVRLSPIGTIQGRVVDPLGAGLEGIEVQAVRLSLRPARREPLELFGPPWVIGPSVTESGPDGRFEVEDIEPGRYRLWAGKRGLLFAHSKIFKLGDEPLTDPFELVLHPLPAGKRIDGRVVGVEGEALAEISIFSSVVTWESSVLDFSFAAGTDEHGRFTIPVASGTFVHLRAETHGGEFRSTTERDVPAGGTEITLRVFEARTVRLRVMDEEERAVRRAFVQLRRVGEESSKHFRQAKDAPDGEVVISLPEQAFTLEVRAPGLLPAIIGPFDPESTHDELHCTLESPSRVRGRVTAGGRPLPQAVVQLMRTRTAGELDEIGGFPTRLNGDGLQGVLADAEGRFELPVMLDHEYVLFAEADGWAAAEIGPLRLDTLRDEELDIELTKGGGIEGRVIVPEGESAAAISVRFGRGDSRVHTARTDQQGRYRIEGLTAGSWMVRATRIRRESPRGFGVGVMIRRREVAEAYEWLGDCDVFEGQITLFDVELEAQEVGAFEVRVSVDGRPASGLELHVIGGDAAWGTALPATPRGRTGQDGSHRLQGLETGAQQLVLQSRAGPLRATRVVVPIELVRGENELSLELASAPLEIELDERPPGELRLLTRLPGGGVALREIELEGGVRKTIPAVIRGQVELLCASAESDRSDPLAWEPIWSESHFE